MKKSGTSMGGTIEYIHSVKPIPCECPRCYHAKVSAGVLFCVYYDKIKPEKKQCARYSCVPGKNLLKKKAKKKRKSSPKKA